MKCNPRNVSTTSSTRRFASWSSARASHTTLTRRTCCLPLPCRKAICRRASKGRMTPDRRAAFGNLRKSALPTCWHGRGTHYRSCALLSCFLSKRESFTLCWPTTTRWLAFWRGSRCGLILALYLRQARRTSLGSITFGIGAQANRTAIGGMGALGRLLVLPQAFLWRRARP